MGLVPSVEADQEEMLDVIGKEHGYRVHHVEADSPAALAGLVSILDYIVVANGVRVDQEDGRLVQMIGESKDLEMRLCIFNTHTLRTREVTIVPNDKWGGSGLLGCTIRFDVLHSHDKHTLHVLDVYESSPASMAGLEGNNDYIIAVGDLLYNGMNEFMEIVHHNMLREVRLYVYNAATETVRECPIVPDNQWGGDGTLGCALGAGYLHLLPQSRLRVLRRPNRQLASSATGRSSGDLAAPEVATDANGSSGPVAAPPPPTSAQLHSLPSPARMPERTPHSLLPSEDAFDP
ncbi:GRASP55/65 PDZ-like domain-containing protein [Pavlovales sp. CCMP2436]|nr:GRASP55/65 PDZ-like domain-containing protein [Pavlovales sp. CCMP2436]|mmetsp:Transcript_11179/g.28228  ORF Transcript_11179/g.28228 Transcript_11179/m.28228 type:complete len:291 (+) Transcript_11179:61-933(+)